MHTHTYTHAHTSRKHEMLYQNDKISYVNETMSNFKSLFLYIFKNLIN